MAHFAKLDQNNKVTAVLAVDDVKIINSNGNEDENIGIEFLKKVTGWPLWKQTSHNTRWNFASIGYTYDENNDIFIYPKPYESWIFNLTTASWEAPVPYPENTFTDGIQDTYTWNETSGSWGKM